MKKVMDEARNNFDQFGVVIRYLERACIKMPGIQQKPFKKSLSGDFAQFKELFDELEGFYKDRALSLFNNFEVLQLVEILPLCAAMSGKFQNFEYLAKITEETLWEFYYPCLESAGNEPFVDFTQENKESFNRLKLRSIENRLKNLQDSEKNKPEPGIEPASRQKNYIEEEKSFPKISDDDTT